MKIKKMRILAMVVSSVFVASLFSVAAADEYEHITDGVGDVIDLNTGGVVEEHPDIDVENIDIVELTYERDGESVTLTLRVKGEIERRGDISDFSLFYDYGYPEDEYPEDELEFDIDSVGYAFMLVTSDERYELLYANEKCWLTYESIWETITLSEGNFTAKDDTLTISFEVNTTNETYESISVFTHYVKFNFSFSDLEEMDEEDLEDLMVILTDQAPNDPLEAYATVTNLGEVGKEVEFEGFAMFGQPPYEYQWDFGDGSTSSKHNPTHIYDKAGKYTYILAVTDNSGSSESDTGNIEIAGTSEDNGTPGFELVIVIAALVLILLWRRK